jgi:hypothetical protein
MMVCTPAFSASLINMKPSGCELWPVSRINWPFVSRVRAVAMISRICLVSGSSSPSAHGVGYFAQKALPSLHLAIGM